MLKLFLTSNMPRRGGQGAAGPTPEPAAMEGPTSSNEPTSGDPVGDGSTGDDAAKQDGSFSWGGLWEKTQRDTQTTLKFFEEEHKKNVEKMEKTFNEIKDAADAAVEDIKANIQGRKSLQVLRAEKVSK